MARSKLIDTVVSPRDDLSAFVDELNKAMKGVGRIDRGADISWLDPPRIRTGILGIDVASGGGLPRGGIVQFWGGFSAGKTTSAMHAMRMEQRAGRNTAFCAGEGFSKQWARQNGLWIAFSKSEYENLDAEFAEDPEGKSAQLNYMQAYDSWGTQNGFADVAVIQHMHGDGLLEAAARAIKRNIFSIIVIDSLAVLKNTRQIEEAEIGDEETGGGGQIQMFNRFIGRCFSALNTKYDESNTIDMNGNMANGTCVLCLNQHRVKFGGRARPGQIMYKSFGGEGLAHAWMFSLEFRRGEELGAETKIDGVDKWTPWGSTINVVCDKSKICVRGRRANWDLYTADHGEFKAGDVDSAQEARIWGVYYNIIEQSGHTYLYNGEKLASGKDNVDTFLRTNEAIRLEIEEKVIAACRQG